MKQVLHRYLQSIHPRNIKLLMKDNKPSFFLMIWWFMLYPFILNQGKKPSEEAIQTTVHLAIRLLPLLLMSWSNIAGRIPMSKAMFLAPLKEAERKEYIKNTLYVKIGIPMLLSLILEILLAFFYQTNAIQIFVVEFAMFSMGLGEYLCCHLINKHDRHIDRAFVDKDGQVKEAVMNIMNVALGYFLFIGLEYTDFTPSMRIFDEVVVISLLLLMLVFDIRILKTRYQSTVDTISNYERYFLIKGKVK
ncbi:MAG: hypothetical protein IJC10_03320 [Clostridia bacterium]|nr:hypothetical protein [Clostridia bacterium]